MIAGGGPVGLLLACELRLAGVNVQVFDKLAERTGESRASALLPRTLELFDQRGMLEPFLDLGVLGQLGHFSGLYLDFSRFDTRHPYALSLLQAKIERLLEQRAKELGVEVCFSSEVTGFVQDESGIIVEVSQPHGHYKVRAEYLAGCDGGRSTVRKLAGIEFPGTPATMTTLFGDVKLTAPPAAVIFQEAAENGRFSVLSYEPGWYRVVTQEYDRVRDRDTPVTFADLRAAFIRIAGTDYGMHSPNWISSTSDAARQACRYRAARILLAGDAAHIHYPLGGQGLSTGLQDVFNLGWKLAMVVHGHVEDSLLDTYHTERHPVAARVLHNTLAQVALTRLDPQSVALREVFASLVALDVVNEDLGGLMSGLDVKYPLGEKHSLLGCRVPDLDLKTNDGSTRLYKLLRPARPILLDLADDPSLRDSAKGWSGRVDAITAICPVDRWSIPGAGNITAPAAVLVRPDGYVAWV
ncbi:MAG: FAD-dependent monooxygenase, partial [Candidatus Dormibacteraceae bacterium]